MHRSFWLYLVSLLNDSLISFNASQSFCILEQGKSLFTGELVNGSVLDDSYFTLWELLPLAWIKKIAYFEKSSGWLIANNALRLNHLKICWLWSFLIHCIRTCSWLLNIMRLIITFVYVSFNSPSLYSPFIIWRSLNLFLAFKRRPLAGYSRMV